MRWLLILAAISSGCDEPASGDAGVPDFGTNGGEDLSPAGHGQGHIGDPCDADADCIEGLKPICFAESVAGFAPAVTHGGYCSASCGKTTLDCGSTALCMWFGFAEPYCYKPCAGAADCRAGYACMSWMAPVCFPEQPFFTCDPSADGGACTTADGHAGGCYRLGLGTGLVGRCGAICDIGVGNCAPDPSGAPLRCREVNDTVDADGGATGDRFAGPVCDLLSAVPTTGGCVYAWTTPVKNYATACADGWDCASQFDPYGDEDCRQFCYLDGGAPAGDAGVLTPCQFPGDCTDVFAVGAEPDPAKRVGLCPMGP